MSFRGIVFQQGYRLLYRVAAKTPGVRSALRKLGFSWNFGHSLVAANLPNPVRTRGLLLHYDPRLYEPVRVALAAGIYEEDVRLLIEMLLHPGMTMVDLGAGIGYFSLMGARRVGARGRVYAFEPDPVQFAILEQNVEANRLQAIIRCINVAVANTEGVAILYEGAVDSGASSLYRSRNVKDTGRVRRRVRRHTGKLLTRCGTPVSGRCSGT